MAAVVQLHEANPLLARREIEAGRGAGRADGGVDERLRRVHRVGTVERRVPLAADAHELAAVLLLDEELELVAEVRVVLAVERHRGAGEQHDLGKVLHANGR